MHQTGPADPASTPNLRALARPGRAPRAPTPRPPRAHAQRPARLPRLRPLSQHARAQRPARPPASLRLTPACACASRARSFSLPRTPRRIVAAQPAVSWPCVRTGMAVLWPASRNSAQPPSHNTIFCIAANFQPN